MTAEAAAEAKGAEVAAMATEAIFEAVSAKRAHGQRASAEKVYSKATAVPLKAM